MPSSPTTNHPAPSRAMVAARGTVLRRIKAEHRAIRNAWREFRRLDLVRDAQAAQVLVRCTIDCLARHGRFEQDHLYPALRAINDDARAVERAGIEHAALDTLIERLQSPDCADAATAALFEVLCDHAVQHIRHEEAQLLPQLERAPVDWLGLVTLLEQDQPQAAAVQAQAQPVGSAPEQPESARPAPPAVSGEAVPVLHTSPVPLATPADDTLPPDTVRAHPDTPAERRAAHRSAPIK